jgi:hypothetical protein
LGSAEACLEPRPVAIVDAEFAALPTTLRLVFLKLRVDLVLDQDRCSATAAIDVDNSDVGLAIVADEATPSLFESWGRLAGDPMDERIPERLGAVQRNHEKKI